MKLMTPAKAKEALAARRLRRGRSGATADSRPGWTGYGFLGLVILVSVYPLYWAFMIASNPEGTIQQRQVLTLPGGEFLSNVEYVIDQPMVRFWQSTWNSAFVATVVAVSVVFFSTLAGYAFAKLRFRGSKGLLYFVIATLAVPTQLAIVPLYIIVVRLKMNEHLPSVILPALVSAFGVFWMTQYLRNALPFELIEAARVDGASMFRTFWSVALPIARPAAAMLALFTFIATWTNFFWPYIALGNSQAKTLPVALTVLAAPRDTPFGAIFTGVLLSIVPLLLLFLLVGRQLVKGIMEGAVKG